MADLSKMRDLCEVLGFNLLQSIRAEVDRSIEDIDSWLSSDLKPETIDCLNEYVETLSRIKSDTFSELKRTSLSIFSYWDVLAVPFEEKKGFTSLMYYVGVESADEITQTNALSLEFIKKVENEHDRLRTQMNAMVLKKRSKLEEILKTSHLPSNFNDKAIFDPVEALADVKIQISRAKVLASKRASIVTKIELLQHANEEVQWYKASKKDAVPLDDARSMEAKLLQNALPTMMSKLEAELADWNDPFTFDGDDASAVLKVIQDNHKDMVGTSAVKTVEKDMAGTSAVKSVEEGTAIGVEATDEDMEVDADRALIPMSLQFRPKAPRSNRWIPQQLPPPPTPPGSSSDDMLSGSSEKTDPDDSDYDPGQDV